MRHIQEMALLLRQLGMDLHRTVTAALVAVVQAGRLVIQTGPLAVMLHMAHGLEVLHLILEQVQH